MTDTHTDLLRVLIDAPTKATEDLLGFKPHAERLAAMLLKQQLPDSSLVVGIEGEWGEGKSSFINLLKAAFPTEQSDEARPIIVDFNPWWFEGSDQLLRHFFDELLGQIDRSGRWTASARKFMRGLASLLDGGGKAAQLVSDPGVMAVGKAAETASGLLHKFAAEKTKSVHVLKASSKHVLEAQNFKTIVFIDDLDRLPAREIVELFRVIKAVADLPNIVYVIAYDRAIVASALDEVHKGRGEAYLEKIIQLPYALPVPTPENWAQYNTALFAREGWHFDGIGNALTFSKLVEALLPRPRDTKRLLIALLAAEALAEEIRMDELDFLFLEALRLKQRGVWLKLLDAVLDVDEYDRLPDKAKDGGLDRSAWLQQKLPLPATREGLLLLRVLRHFTGWPLTAVTEVKVDPFIAVTEVKREPLGRRLSMLGSSDAPDRQQGLRAVKRVVRAYRQQQLANGEHTRQACQAFLGATDATSLAAYLPASNVKAFLYEMPAYAAQNGLWPETSRHLTAVVTWLTGPAAPAAELSGWLDDYVYRVLVQRGYSLSEEQHEQRVIQTLWLESRQLVSDWIANGNIPPFVWRQVYLSKDPLWQDFKREIAAHYLGKTLADLLAIPEPSAAMVVLSGMAATASYKAGSTDALAQAAQGSGLTFEDWLARLPAELGKEQMPAFGELFADASLVEEYRLLAPADTYPPLARLIKQTLAADQQAKPEGAFLSEQARQGMAFWNNQLPGD